MAIFWPISITRPKKKLVWCGWNLTAHCCVTRRASGSGIASTRTLEMNDEVGVGIEVNAAVGAVGGPRQKYRSTTRKWFLTYPRCDLSKEELLAHLQSLGKLDEFCICRETHEDGGLHLHAYVWFDKPGLPNKDCVKFDFNGHHGDYQSVRSRSRVLKYVQKADADVLTNIDKELLVDKGAKRKRENLEIFNGSEVELKRLVMEGEYSWRQLIAILKARHAFRLMTLKPLTSQNVKGIWICGEPGCGKSHWARNAWPSAYLKLQNKWFDGYDLQEEILLEDFDFQKLGHHLKLWSDKWGCHGEVKGGLTPLLHSRFIITSNYTITKLFGEDAALCAAVSRRFQQLTMTPGGRLYRDEDLVQRWDGGQDKLVQLNEGEFDVNDLFHPMAYGPARERR